MPQAIIDTLKLPKLVFPVATITIGWPDENPPLSDRLPIGTIMHVETFHDYAPSDIDQAYAYKEGLPENKQFVELNHKQTLAQVFTDCRYTKADCEAMSATLVDALRKQGFINN